MPLEARQMIEECFSFSSQMLAQGDPRALLQGLLESASSVAQIIAEHKRMDPAHMAAAFGQALVVALSAPTAEESPKIILNGAH